MLKKIILIIAIILILLIIVMVFMFLNLDKPREANQKILKSKETNPESALIVYQPSMSSITDEVANEIAKGLNDQGYEVTLNYPNNNLDKDVSNYSVIIFGTPTYGGKPLSIVIDYMSQIKNVSSTQKIVLFSTGGNMTEKSEIDAMEKSLNGVKPYRKIKFGNENGKEEAYEFGKKLLVE